MSADSKVETVLKYTTPWGAIKRASTSITSAKGALQESAKALGNTLPGQPVDGQYEEDDVRSITDAKLRFETMYVMHAWTPEALAQQVRVLRRTKITAFVMSVISAGAVIAVAVTVPRWVALLMIPLAGGSMLLGFAQGFKHGLYEAQIHLRELISAREFVSRDDFWQRLLG